MFTLGNTLTYQLYRGVCDMRKSFDGLCGYSGQADPLFRGKLTPCSGAK